MRKGILCAAFAAVLLPSATHAGPNDPIVMTASGGTQSGHLITSNTSEKRGNTCMVLHADGFRQRPEAVAHDGSALTWVIPGSRKPKSVSLRVTTYPLAYVPVTTSDPREVPVKVAPVRSRGRVTGWSVTSPETGEGDHELVLGVTWRGACVDDNVTREYFVRVPPDLVRR